MWLKYRGKIVRLSSFYAIYYLFCFWEGAIYINVFKTGKKTKPHLPSNSPASCCKCFSSTSDCYCPFIHSWQTGKFDHPLPIRIYRPKNVKIRRRIIRRNNSKILPFVHFIGKYQQICFLNNASQPFKFPVFEKLASWIIWTC